MKTRKFSPNSRKRRGTLIEASKTRSLNSSYSTEAQTILIAQVIEDQATHKNSSTIKHSPQVWTSTDASPHIKLNKSRRNPFFFPEFIPPLVETHTSVPEAA